MPFGEAVSCVPLLLCSLKDLTLYQQGHYQLVSDAKCRKTRIVTVTLVVVCLDIAHPRSCGCVVAAVATECRCQRPIQYPRDLFPLATALLYVSGRLDYSLFTSPASLKKRGQLQSHAAGSIGRPPYRTKQKQKQKKNVEFPQARHLSIRTLLCTMTSTHTLFLDAVSAPPLFQLSRVSSIQTNANSTTVPRADISMR